VSISKTIEYGSVVSVSVPFDDAVAQMEAALLKEGFGVLCRIDVQAKLKEKLGIDFPRYLILGACNPALAHRALQAESEIGLLLPCNAVVYEHGGEVFAGVIDARKMLSVVGNASLEGVASQVDEKLRRALAAVSPA
jgi:uncharacterized protein (DUF302 family)